MKLGRLFPQTGLNSELSNREIRGLSIDTRRTEKGDLFFVIPGSCFDIISFLPSIAASVSAFVMDSSFSPQIGDHISGTPVIYTDNVRKQCLRCAGEFYPLPAADCNFAAVTGTNGKTTVSYLIYQLLKSAGYRASLLGTVFYYINDQQIQSSHTTPDFLLLRKLLSRLDRADPGFVIMEASSHGLDQGRVADISFDSCVFTNLSRDHLDYHQNMDNYFLSKKKLFYANPQAKAVINTDDSYGLSLARELDGEIISYGLEETALWRADDISYSGKGTDFCLRYRDLSLPVSTSLVGVYNIYNLLAAFSCLYSLGLSLDEISAGLSGLKPPCGRLEQVSADVFVDYAHTPDALSKTLSVLRAVGYKKIISLFGCGGDRDRGKRRIMGSVSCSLADFTIITSDNPRSEDPAQICAQIRKGCTEGKYREIIDRREALARGLKMQNNDPECALLVAGKGHEDYQIIGKDKIHFSDQEEIRRILNKENEHS